MDPRVIRNEQQYDQAVEQIRQLMATDPPAGSAEAERLELLAVLTADFERDHFPISNPSPIEAVRFRMDQLGLTQRDLIPFIGSRSKVSEILSAKRPLTLSMIRALHDGLGIPLAVLVQELAPAPRPPLQGSWDTSLVREMKKRNWDVDLVSQFARQYVGRAGGAFVGVHLKAGQFIRSARSMDQEALLAWTGRVLSRAAASRPRGEFAREALTSAFLQQVSQLSWAENGPLLAGEFLSRHGIAMVIEPHLPRTYIDGAALCAQDGYPVVALTLRHDRLDNFWFTLLHELVHVKEHLQDSSDVFIDDLDYEDSDDLREIDADNGSSTALIPERAWHAFNARGLFTQDAIEKFAVEQHIHVAIVAGRIRRLRRNYRILTNLVGQDSVRKLFAGS